MSMIGKTLGTFTLEAQIGKGGMGEVYKAKDQKLGRDVAIKVLPEEFAKDADRVARFQREAKLLASLNHPNIAAIHGLEEADDTHFLVLELIEGDTLADRLKRGAIPVEESLKLALQIAEALEAAHEKGVIHRDLKPANIKVTPDGKVKVLDFGLAKAFAGEQEDMNLSNSPTLSVAATQQGIILGTAAYMSPEQASGETTDKRADIWAFGVVLYEMLTGRSLFAGDNVSQTLARVLEREPDFSALPPNLHFRIRLLLERCLEKDVKSRSSGIGDARADIQKVLADPSGVFAQPITAVKPRKKMRLGIPWVAAIFILGLLIAWFLKPAPPPEPKQVMRFYHELPEGQAFTTTLVSVFDLSADGTKIVYIANDQLYIRDLKELTAKPIQGTNEDPSIPIFSPDGLWVGFSSGIDSQWKKITVSGGAPVTLCDAGLPSGATWGSDETILFGEEAGIMRVSANDGTAELLIEAKNGERFHRPQALTDGEWILFTVRGEGASGWDEAQIAVQSLKTGERNILVSGGSDARYVPTGHLVYALGDVLYAKAFNTDSMEVTGGAVSIVEGVQRAGATGAANYAFSDTGMLAYVVGSAEAIIRTNLVWVDRNGEEEPIGAEPKGYATPSISPDGTRVALTIDEDGNEDIWIRDLDRGTGTRLTFDGAVDDHPVWTPDSQRIIFNSERAGRSSIFWKAADGTGKAEQIGSMEGGSIWPVSLANDGKTLFFGQWHGQASKVNIGVLSMDGDRTLKLLLQEEFNERNPRISPDGRWLAYASDESGQNQVYIRPFPDVDSGGKWQVSTDGGSALLWSPDGKELFYAGPDDEAMVVSVETEPSFRLGTPQNLFNAKQYRGWDIHPDGKRFLVLKESTGDTSSEEAQRPRINIIANWFEELKERIPVD